MPILHFSPVLYKTVCGEWRLPPAHPFCLGLPSWLPSFISSLFPHQHGLFGNWEEEEADSYLNTGKSNYHNQGNIMEYNPFLLQYLGTKGSGIMKKRRYYPLTAHLRYLQAAHVSTENILDLQSLPSSSKSLGSYFFCTVSRYRGGGGETTDDTDPLFHS